MDAKPPRLLIEEWLPAVAIDSLPPAAYTRVADTIEVKRRILGWGAAAEVLEPARLRRAIAAEARKIAGRG